MELASAQFTFAINQYGKLTHIAETKPHDTYRCCDCDNVLIPIQGDIRTHHFRHSTAICSYESYLHKASKLAFYQRFQEAKAEKISIALELKRSKICRSKKAALLQEIEITCNSVLPARYNLTTLFDSAKLEKFDPDTGLIPDILLSSNTYSARKCYVEINVTHPCSEDKIDRAIPIIEFDVNGEADIAYIRTEDFSISDPRVTLYHFYSPDDETYHCHEYCCQRERPIGIWSLSDSGRLNKKNVTLGQLDTEELNDGNCWSNELDTKQQTDKVISLLQKYDPENRFPSCIRCMHCGSWDQSKIFCALKGLSASYTEARKCMDYEIIA